MANINPSVKRDIEKHAERFLAEHGFTNPPLHPGDALEARKLQVVQLSFEDFLEQVCPKDEERHSIQAVLDVGQKVVAFREGLPRQKISWGSLHEVGHDFLPWHRELLFFCSLLQLPIEVQEQLEAEADAFAAEAFFFGSNFRKTISQSDYGLEAPIYLAEEVYKTSYHATFMHYVRQSPDGHCLLVWKPGESDEGDSPQVKPVLSYYVRSPKFRQYFPTKQITRSEEISAVLNNPNLGLVKHRMTFRAKSGATYTANAESFCNSYNVFTLIDQLKKE